MKASNFANSTYNFSHKVFDPSNYSKEEIEEIERKYVE